MARVLFQSISSAAIALVTAVLFPVQLLANALLWDWSFLGTDGSVQQGMFVSTVGDTTDRNTIYTVTEFAVSRSDAGHFAAGAPLGSTTDGTYHAFAGVPMTFGYIDNRFIFGPGSGLGGRFDTDYDSPLGYYSFVFVNQPRSPPGPNLGEGYLYYFPPGQPFDCCNNGTVTTQGPRAVTEPSTWVLLLTCVSCLLLLRWMRTGDPRTLFNNSDIFMSRRRTGSNEVSFREMRKAGEGREPAFARVRRTSGAGGRVGIQVQPTKWSNRPEAAVRPDCSKQSLGRYLRSLPSPSGLDR